MPVLAPGERQIDQVISSCVGRRGILYLTDRRLIFEWSEGLVSKKHQQIGVALADIQAVNAAHGLLGVRELVVSTQSANNGFGTNRVSIGIAMSPEIWMGKINSLLGTRTAQVAPTVLIEKEVVRTPCRYCRTLVDAFRDTKCPNCGAPIH